MMKELTKAQESFLRLQVTNEYRKIIGKTPLYNGSKLPTQKALVKKGLGYFLPNVPLWKSPVCQLTEEGREWGIALLDEPGRKEMESDFYVVKLEQARKTAAEVIATTLLSTYNLETWEVDVQASHQYWESEGFEYSISFNQKNGQWRDGSQRYVDYVRISPARKEGYRIATTSSHFELTVGKRMAELMLIAVQVIESGLLTS